MKRQLVIFILLIGYKDSLFLALQIVFHIERYLGF
nr:MAG TPA: hypothetical protein [Caudoviricetes sp.]